MTRDELLGHALIALGGATREQLAALWPAVTPARGLLELLVERGALDPAEAQRLRSLAGRGPFPGLVLLRELSRGGMGVVFEAIELATRRRVVVKQILGAVDEAARLRFRREAQALARLESPHIVKAFGYGEAREGPYLTLEFVRGETLSARSKTQGGLAEEELRSIGLDLTEALAAIHEVGLLHRDLKPENILIEAETGRVVVVDFGLARSQQRWAEGVTLEEVLTRSVEVTGTPSFMAPEQFDSRSYGEATEKTDVWGLCATLAAAWTGTPPFGAGSALAIYRRVLEERLAVELPGSLGAALREGLRLDPDHRSDLEALRAALAEERVAAPNPRVPLALALLGLLLVAAAVAVGASWGLSKAPVEPPRPKPRVEPALVVTAPAEPIPMAPVPLFNSEDARRCRAGLRSVKAWRELPASDKTALELWMLSQLDGAVFRLELRRLPLASDPRESWVAVHETGIALRLIPGGRMTLGTTEAQAEVRRALIRRHCEGDSTLDIEARVEKLDARISARERPAVALVVPPMLVAIYETSVGEFVKGGGRAARGQADVPIVGVQWRSVQEWCERQRGGLRLPWSAEWEFAASCGDDRIFPWGDAFDGERLWWKGRGVTEPNNPMGRAATPESHANDFGIFDMAGNAWEWNADSELDKSVALGDFKLSKRSYSGLELTMTAMQVSGGRRLTAVFEAWCGFATQSAHLVRGGGFNVGFEPSFAIEEKSFFGNGSRDSTIGRTGFRVVASLPDAVLDVIYEEDE